MEIDLEVMELLQKRVTENPEKIDTSPGSEFEQLVRGIGLPDDEVATLLSSSSPFVSRQDIIDNLDHLIKHGKPKPYKTPRERRQAYVDEWMKDPAFRAALYRKTSPTHLA